MNLENSQGLSAIYRHKTDCDTFYLCSYGAAGLIRHADEKCPPGTLFDAKIGKCNWAGDVDCEYVKKKIFKK